jgi:hypothetical protein
MDLGLIRFLAQTFGASFTSASRPALTFFVVQTMAAFSVRMDWATLPDGMRWLVSFPALGIAATLTVLEMLAQHEPEVSELLRELKIDHLLGAFGAFSAALVFAALGLPEEEARSLVEGSITGTGGDLTLAVESTVATQHPPSVQAAAIGGALSLNLALTWLRGHVHALLDEFDLKGIWQRIETGGVVGLLAVIVFLPVLALGIITLMTLVLAAFGWAAHRAQQWSDARGRVPCAHCEHPVPAEALRCSACGSTLSPHVS